MMLDDVKRGLLSIKNRLQHRPRFLYFQVATVFSIVEHVHAHKDDFAVFCIYGDDFMFIFASRVAA